jgi:hypothetical protein
MLSFRDGIWAKSYSRLGDPHTDSVVIFGELRGRLVMSKSILGSTGNVSIMPKKDSPGEQTFSSATRQGRLGLAGHARLRPTA